jgi:flagellar FliJ protein
MKRFTFRLESLRSLREQAEDRAKLLLAEELATEAAQRERLASASLRLEHARVRAAEGGSSGSELEARQTFVERCERDLAAAAAVLRLQEQRVQEARGVLAEAAREREALERLRRRELAEHELEVRRAEDEILGEVGLAGYRRRVA